jgi:heme o synthase
MLKNFLDLGKFRLSLLVVATTFAGYLLGHHGDLSGPLLPALLGTLLSSLGANGLNQYLERERDARMERTSRRPLPSGRLTPAQARSLSLASAAAGVLVLLVWVNPLTAGLSLLTILLYTLVYTPLKVTSHLNTLVGGLVGAIPPIMGWTAATGQFGFGALALALILFVWQIPHFLGLAWLYREDYAAGGYRMLPVVEPDGQSTGQMMLVYSVALIPAALLLTIGNISGPTYALGAVLLGAAMVATAWRFYFDRSQRNARTVFLASLLYLPLLIALMLGNARPKPDVYIQTQSAPPPAAGVLEATVQGR